MSAYDQTKGELCETCGWAMKFPEEPCRCELERENSALRKALNHAADILEECETSGARQFRVLHRAIIDAARKEAQP